MHSNKRPVVAMVLSTCGFHWEEAFGAFDEFRSAGWAVELYTVDGSPPKVDPTSLKRTGPLSWFGLGVSGANSPETQRGRELMAAIEGARPLDEVDSFELDALYLPGGHGCLFDVNRNDTLHTVISELHEVGRPLSAVCHATSSFAFVEEVGQSIVEGKALTGFPEFVDGLMASTGLVQQEYLPIPFSNDRVLADAGANLMWHHKVIAAFNPRYTRIDRPFITGMGPKAARKVARAVIDTRGEWPVG
jgi:putative intracellular protease/amidase